MTPHERAAAILTERGIRPFSLLGGTRVQSLIAAAIQQDRQDRTDIPGDIGRRTLMFTDQDWALAFDEESGEEAWWIELQLLDPEQRDSNIVEHLAALSLSDVEVERLIGHLQDMVATGRRRFS